jgi:hypothetical protein
MCCFYLNRIYDAYHLVNITGLTYLPEEFDVALVHFR